MDIVSSIFSISVGSLYVRKYFNEDAKKTAVEMVTDIRHEFKKILETVSCYTSVKFKSEIRSALTKFITRGIHLKRAIRYQLS